MSKNDTNLMTEIMSNHIYVKMPKATTITTNSVSTPHVTPKPKIFPALVSKNFFRFPRN